MKGVFGLDNAQDLLGKLVREHERLWADATNSDHLYNFFVTAWHLLEWQYPDVPDKAECEKVRAKRKAVKEETPILEICEHLTIGAKHYEPMRESHKAVLGAKESSVFAGWAKGVWGRGVWGTVLVVELSGKFAEQYGASPRAIDLAKEALDYWTGELSP